MRLFEKHPALRWTVPGAVAALLLGVGSALGTLSAAAGGPLPDRSAAQLLIDVQQAKIVGISGTVHQSADLGLPQLPLPGGAGSFSPASLLSGNHTLRVWYAGPDKTRLALLGTLGEYDFIRNGADIWTWNSDKNEAFHQRTAGSGEKPTSPLPTAGVPKTPQEAADQILKAVEPTTAVSTGTPVQVAGRPAYELVLTPKDAVSLVGSVRIAIDGTEHVPLRVQVFAKDATDPAAEVGFTSVSFTRPDDAQFAFTPPQGAKVTEASADHPSGTPAKPTMGKPSIVGTGWTSVLVAKLPADALGGTGKAGDAQLARILNALPRVSGPWGSGRLLTGKLFSVLLTDDGRLIVGAVAPEQLYAAAR